MSEFDAKAHMPEIRAGDLVSNVCLTRRRVVTDEDAAWWNTTRWLHPTRIERDGRVIWPRS
jgi:hypothetical protein